MCAVVWDNKQKKSMIIWGSIGFILAFLLWFYLGPTYIDPILNPRIEINALQETRIMTLKTQEGVTNSTNVVSTNSTHIYNKNQIFTINLPFQVDYLNVKSYKINKILITTPDFKLNNTIPSLPVSVPTSGKINIIVHVKAPNRTYSGTLSITYFVEVEK